MPKFNDLSRSLVAFEQDSTLVAAIEMSSTSWLVGGFVPSRSRDPQKKLPAKAQALLDLLSGWCEEARAAGQVIKRICVAFEAGRDGFWLARWLQERGIEAYVIHGFKLKQRKAEEQLARLVTAEDKPLPPDALAELHRLVERLRLAKQQMAEIDKTQRERLAKAPEAGPNPLILILARVTGVGLMTAETLVREVLTRSMRDRRAISRYAGLTGSPDESGKKRREQGLAKAGNGRIRRA